MQLSVPSQELLIPPSEYECSSCQTTPAAKADALKRNLEKSVQYRDYLIRWQSWYKGQHNG